MNQTMGLTVNLSSLLIFLLIGAVAGWLAGLIMKGSGFGIIGDIIIGIIGMLAEKILKYFERKLTGWQEKREI